MGKKKTNVQLEAGGSIFLFIISLLIFFVSVLVILSLYFYNFQKPSNKLDPPPDLTTSEMVYNYETGGMPILKDGKTIDKI